MEQGVRGSPHNIEFPTNEELGNFWRESGMEPFKLLLLKFKVLSLGRSSGGIAPEMELF